MVKRGEEYELFCKTLIDKLAGTGAPFSNIKHNVLKKGKAHTNNQIDITFDYDYKGTKIPMIVECKDYTRPVGKEKIATLSSIAHEDLGINGIFFAKSGFQRGAIQYAKAHGIDLYKVTDVTDADWTDRIKKINLTTNVTALCSLELNVQIVGISKDDSKQLLPPPQKLTVLDSFGRGKYLLGDEVKKQFKNNSSKSKFKLDTSDSFVLVKRDLKPIHSIEVVVHRKRFTTKAVIDADEFVTGIFENAISKKWIMVRK